MFFTSAPHMVPPPAMQNKYNVGCPGRGEKLRARKHFHSGSYAA